MEEKPVKRKIRVDVLLCERGLVPSRERARAMILAGRVLVNEQKVDKAGISVSEDAPVRMLGEDLPFVSRGGLKLEAALDRWKIDVRGRACLDVGASTWRIHRLPPFSAALARWRQSTPALARSL